MFIKKILAYLIIISGCVLMYSISMPTYTNETYKAALDEKGMQAMAKNEFVKFEPYYHARLNELRTNKTQLMDISFGVLIAAVTIYCFTLSSKMRKHHNYRAVKTFKKSTLVVVSNIMWLLLIPGVYWHYLFRSGRGDYPWFADDPSIPMGSKLPYLLVGWLLMNLFIAFFAAGSRFPAHLFSKQPQGYGPARGWDIFWGILIFLNTLFLCYLIKDGDQVSIVVSLYLTYLLLSLRAGKVHTAKIIMAKKLNLSGEIPLNTNAD